MTPLFACFPMCMTFVALTIVAVVVVVFGLTNRVPGADHPAAELPPEKGTGPPPWWTLPLMLLALVLLMLALAWYWPE